MSNTSLPQDQLPPLPPSDDGVLNVKTPTAPGTTPSSFASEPVTPPLISPQESPAIAPPTPSEIPHEASFPGQPIPEAEHDKLEEQAKKIIASDGGLPPSKATKSKIMQSALGVLALVLVGAGVFFGQRLVTTGGIGDLRQQASVDDYSCEAKCAVDLSPGSPGYDQCVASCNSTENAEAYKKCQTCTKANPNDPLACAGVCESSCFLPGTKISMADGSYKNIEDVRVGEQVLSFSETGALASYTVGKVSEKERDSYFEVRLENDTTLKLTDNHPIFVKKGDYTGWGSLNPSATLAESRLGVIAYDVGDFVYSENGQWLKILSISKVSEKVKVYNLDSVLGSRSFFADGIYVHNKTNPDCAVGTAPCEANSWACTPIDECVSAPPGDCLGGMTFPDGSCMFGGQCGLDENGKACGYSESAGTFIGLCKNGMCELNPWLFCAPNQPCKVGSHSGVCSENGSECKTPSGGSFKCSKQDPNTCGGTNYSNVNQCHCSNYSGDLCTSTECDPTLANSDGESGSCKNWGRSWCTNYQGYAMTCCEEGYSCCEDSSGNPVNGCCKTTGGGGGGGGTPPPSTPTPPPTSSLSCDGMTSVPASPKLGDAVRYTCTGSSSPSSINHYVFQYKVGSGEFTNLAEQTVGSGQSALLTISEPGTYTVRCRACTSADNTVCSAWQSL